MKDSFIFYRSYFEAIQDLKEKDRVKVYEAICELSLNGNEIKLSGISNTIFKLIKPQIVANNERYENGRKGGRPKKTNGYENEKPMVMKNSTFLKTKTKPNNNVNVNENENVNENVEVDIYNFLSTNFGYLIPPIQAQKLDIWKEVFTDDIIKYAIEKCCDNNARNFNYLEAILTSWKNKGFKKLAECKNEAKKKESEPDWFDKEIKKEVDIKSQREMEEILKDFGKEN